jgi:hypothetical protein
MDRVPPLPAFLNIQQVYSDFLGFMFKHIESYFTKRNAGGTALWDSLKPSAVLIFTIPNGWELAQQHTIRRAAIRAGFFGSGEHNALMTDTLERIWFVCESEAAMVYAADSGYVDSWLEVSTYIAMIISVRMHTLICLQAGNGVIVCNAGGGTIDIASVVSNPFFRRTVTADAFYRAYHIVQEHPLELMEKFASKCLCPFDHPSRSYRDLLTAFNDPGIISGSVLVNQRARDYITGKPWFLQKYY